MKTFVGQVAVACALHLCLSHAAPSSSSTSSSSKDEPVPLTSAAEIKSTAKIIANNTIAYYDGKTPGLLSGYGKLAPSRSALFWPAILDYWHYTGDSTYNDDLSKSILAQRGSHDDFWSANVSDGYWNAQVGAWGDVAMGAAEFKMPDPPKDQPQWVHLADNVFNNFAGQWDTSDCLNGGVRMIDDPNERGYVWKDAEVNGYLFNLAARLGRYTGNQTYLDWADKVWTWMEKVHFITEDGDVTAGLNVTWSQDCKKRTTETRSVDNAVFVAGAAVMYNATNGDSKWKTRLSTVLDAGIARFFPEDTNVLTEMCEYDRQCYQQVYLWKGRTMPLYAYAVKMAPHTASKLLPAIKATGQNSVDRCFSKRNAFAPHCTGSEGMGGRGPEFEVAGLGAVSVLLVDAATAPVTQKSGGTSSPSGSGSGSKEGGSKGSDSGASARQVESLLYLIAATVVGSYLL